MGYVLSQTQYLQHRQAEGDTRSASLQSPLGHL